MLYNLYTGLKKLDYDGKTVIQQESENGIKFRTHVQSSFFNVNEPIDVDYPLLNIIGTDYKKEVKIFKRNNFMDNFINSIARKLVDSTNDDEKITIEDFNKLQTNFEAFRRKSDNIKINDLTTEKITDAYNAYKDGKYGESDKDFIFNFNTFIYENYSNFIISVVNETINLTNTYYTSSHNAATAADTSAAITAAITATTNAKNDTLKGYKKILQMIIYLQSDLEDKVNLLNNIDGNIFKSDDTYKITDKAGKTTNYEKVFIKEDLMKKKNYIIKFLKHKQN